MPEHIASDSPRRVIREAECKLLTGLSRTTRWRLERKGEFPARVPLSVGCHGWFEDEVQTWLEACAARRDGSEAA